VTNPATFDAHTAVVDYNLGIASFTVSMKRLQVGTESALRAKNKVKDLGSRGHNSNTAAILHEATGRGTGEISEDDVGLVTRGAVNGEYSELVLLHLAIFDRGETSFQRQFLGSVRRIDQDLRIVAECSTVGAEEVQG
jgi:hypothetical protein